MKKTYIFGSLLTCLLLMLVLIWAAPTQVLAASEGNLTFELNSDGKSYTISSCNVNASGEMVIPDTHNGLPVTSIGSYAFHRCFNLTNVTIPDSITSIGEGAFFMLNLTSVTIPDSVTSIGNEAFRACAGLTNVVIGNGVTSIGEEAFLACFSLSNVTLGNSVNNIDDYAFRNCYALNSIAIPDSVTRIGWSAFDGCTNLKRVDISDIAAWCAITFGGSRTNPLHNGASLYLNGELVTELVISDGVTSIASCAFDGCAGLTSVTVPDSVTIIGAGAFDNCDSLTDVYYAGTQAQWEAVDIRGGNDCLNNATIHFNDSPQPDNPPTGGCTNHTWNSGTITKKTTCKEAGVKTFTCTVCGDTKTENLAKLTTHSWNNGTVTKKATCKETGVKSYTCTICGKTKTENLPKLTTHSYKSEWSKDGTNHWHECSVCQNKKDLAAHTPGAAATETTAQTCTICGYVIQESVANAPCALDELTDLDFLAFSNLAYFEFPKAGTTVKEMLGSKWNTEWSQGIKYSELYNHIQNWTFDRGVENKSSGFCAHSYRNNQNELILVYRGSEDLNNIASKTEDWWADWIATNLIMLLNNDSEQIDSAITFYSHIMRDYAPAKVAITGHSLGGALGDIVAAYSGCKGVTFNAAPFLDIAYSCHIKQMAVAFTGVDTWTFTDIINKEDVVGMVGNSIKPRRICPDNGLTSSAHSLKSFVNKNQYGMLYLTAGVTYTVDQISWAMPDLKSIVDMPDDISDWLLEDDFKLGYYVDLGTSGDDEFYGALSAKTIYDVVYQLLGGSCKHYAYGGNGSDSICTGVLNDTIVGGKGTDFLSGSWGDDIYIYNKGDGVDYIIDPHGEDCLLLYGFENDDVIHFESELDSDYIDVYCNLDVIIRIDKNCRDGWQLDNFSVRVNPDSSWDTYNIPARLFNPQKYTQRYVICCPVNIAFVDKDGNVVEVIQDGKTGIYSGEYGIAVVYLDESGDCCKAIDLTEGYTIQVLGHSDGKMDIAMCNVEDGVLSESCYVIESVEVTETMRASINESNDGAVTLAVDANGDGTVEDNHILSLVTGENTPSDESTQPTEGSTQPTEGTHANIPDNKDDKDTCLDIWWIAIAVVSVVAVGGVCVVCIIRKRKGK